VLQRLQQHALLYCAPLIRQQQLTLVQGVMWEDSVAAVSGRLKAEVSYAAAPAAAAAAAALPAAAQGQNSQQQQQQQQQQEEEEEEGGQGSADPAAADL